MSLLYKDAAGNTKAIKATLGDAGYVPHNNIDTLPALVAGTAHIGSATVDTALPAGTAHIGKVEVDTALPTGTNSIGKVGTTIVPATVNTNGATAKTTSPALAANLNRKKWGIQNAGTNVLNVVMGATAINLAACLAADDGTGGSIEDTYWQGAVTVTGTSPRYNVFEFV